MAKTPCTILIPTDPEALAIWISENRAKYINLVRSHDISEQDAEDIYSNYTKTLITLGPKRLGIPSIQSFVMRLYRNRDNFIRRRSANKRQGSNAGLDFVEYQERIYNLSNSDEFASWILAHGPFAINSILARASDLTREDAEDIFGDLLMGLTFRGYDKIGEPTTQNLMCHLKRYYIRFVRRRNAQKRGCGDADAAFADYHTSLFGKFSTSSPDIRVGYRDLLGRIIDDASFSKSIKERLLLDYIGILQSDDVPAIYEAMSARERGKFLPRRKVGAEEYRSVVQNGMHRTLSELRKRLRHFRKKMSEQIALPHAYSSE